MELLRFVLYVLDNDLLEDLDAMGMYELSDAKSWYYAKSRAEFIGSFASEDDAFTKGNNLNILDGEYVILDSETGSVFN